MARATTCYLRALFPKILTLGIMEAIQKTYRAACQVNDEKFVSMLVASLTQITKEE